MIIYWIGFGGLLFYIVDIMIDGLVMGYGVFEKRYLGSYGIGKFEFIWIWESGIVL